jgi:hypothetical protein
MIENNLPSSVEAELNDLLAAVAEVSKDIDVSNQDARETLEHVEARVHTATADISDICDELDMAAVEAEEDLDTLILTEIDAIVESEA